MAKDVQQPELDCEDDADGGDSESCQQEESKDELDGERIGAVCLHRFNTMSTTPYYRVASTRYWKCEKFVGGASNAQNKKYDDKVGNFMDGTRK